MKILFLSNWFPHPPINGAKIRIFNLIKQLARKHEITLLSFAQTIPYEEAEKQVPILEQYCRSVDIIPARKYSPRSFAGYQGLFSIQPRIVAQTYSPEMERLVDKKINSESFDVIIASEVNAPSVTSLIASRINGIPKIIDALEIGIIKNDYYDEQQFIRRIRNGMTWLKLREFTRNILSNSQICTVPSAVEKQNILKIISNELDVEIVPHCVDLAYYEGPFGIPKQNSLVFTGSFTYRANEDAAFYFFELIYPQIKSKIPDVTVKVVGNTNGVDISSWPIDENVTFTGLLKDVRQTVSGSMLSVVPLRMGAGTRLKIIESMAMGTPVVSTSKGAEGLEVTHGENIIIADDPKEFASSILQVLQDRQFHERLSKAGYQLVKERYSSESLGLKFDNLLDNLSISIN